MSNENNNNRLIIILVCVILAIALIIGAVAFFGTINSKDEPKASVSSVSQSNESQTPATGTPDGTQSQNGHETPSTQGGTDAGKQNVQNGTSAQEKKYTPTFMYFVAKSDASYEAAMNVAKELETEYGERVKFMIQDVDENPDLKDKYMINKEGMGFSMKTPTLIMLDTSNNISTIGLSECTDKVQLKEAIEKALNAGVK